MNTGLSILRRRIIDKLTEQVANQAGELANLREKYSQLELRAVKAEKERDEQAARIAQLEGTLKLVNDLAKQLVQPFRTHSIFSVIYAALNPPKNPPKAEPKEEK